MSSRGRGGVRSEQGNFLPNKLLRTETSSNAKAFDILCCCCEICDRNSEMLSTRYVSCTNCNGRLSKNCKELINRGTRKCSCRNICEEQEAESQSEAREENILSSSSPAETPVLISKQINSELNIHQQEEQPNQQHQQEEQPLQPHQQHQEEEQPQEEQLLQQEKEDDQDDKSGKENVPVLAAILWQDNFNTVLDELEKAGSSFPAKKPSIGDLSTHEKWMEALQEKLGDNCLYVEEFHTDTFDDEGLAVFTVGENCYMPREPLQIIIGPRQCERRFLVGSKKSIDSLHSPNKRPTPPEAIIGRTVSCSDCFEEFIVFEANLRTCKTCCGLDDDMKSSSSTTDGVLHNLVFVSLTITTLVLLTFTITFRPRGDNTWYSQRHHRGQQLR